MMYRFLRKVPLFADLPEEDLERLCEGSREMRIAAGETLFEEGDRGDAAYVIKSGKLEILKSSGGKEILLAVRESGEVIGEVALLEEAPRMASARGQTEVELIAISKEQLTELIDKSPSAARTMFYTVISRLRSTTAMLQQSEKMAQLGTLTAGVAHELNNPAAAVRRGAEQLTDSLEYLLRARAELHVEAMSDEGRQRFDALVERVRSTSTKYEHEDALARSDREAALEETLESHGIEDAWEVAPLLAGIGFDAAEVEAMARDFDAGQMVPVARYLARLSGTYSLLAEVGQGAARVSSIVKALKSYSYLDQAPVQEVDVHEGLDDTLLILRNKLKRGIKVVREYDPDLPKIQAYGSELNQVWTNLIDNAIDALGDQTDGQITLKTRGRDSSVEVCIQDNGPGIPEEIQKRVFDAFFTTKPPGKGTGLGLDISYNIVAHKHRGSIDLFSEPGTTIFTVRLPLDPAEPVTSELGSSVRPSDEALLGILDRSKTIAVVGISEQPNRPGHTVPLFLKEHGYRIIPVHPSAERVLDEPVHRSLRDIGEPIDVVLIFRRPDAVPAVVEDAIAIGTKTVWMQEGVIHEQAAERARRAGIDVVMDACMRATYKRLKE